MLILAYEGWFQCRLATDPDPTEEKWGITGSTFAGPGEPPLDRIIRLQNAQALRYPQTEKPFGVNVTNVYETTLGTLGDPATRTALPDHPLVGAAVDFLGDVKYHQRNYIVVEGLLSPIDPFIVRVAGNGIDITRKDEWDETRPGLGVNDIFLDAQILAHRGQTMEIKSPRLVEITGTSNYDKFWADRLADLKDKLTTTTDPTEVAALKKRIAYIEETEADTGTRVSSRQFLGLLSTYTVDINGAATILDPDNAMGGEVGTSQVWPMEFWMGAYDVDTLCGYMKGTLSLPFHRTG